MAAHNLGVVATRGQEGGFPRSEGWMLCVAGVLNTAGDARGQAVHVFCCWLH